ncbi:thiol:disulfide interchange protein [Sphingomonas koreensis]|nr:thiol:disulfide interchange protein [Sphingomonas koreensis]
MRATGFAFVTFVIALLGLASTAQADGPPALGDGPHLAIRLVAETDTPAAGSDVTLALDTRPTAGWHGYWTNPGDAGFPAKLDWTLPKGVTASDPAYPMPTTLLIAGLMNYVYEKPYAPLVTLHVPAGLAKGTPLPIKLHMSYLVCSAEICVPENADLSADLTVGDGAVSPDRRAQFDQWRQAQPKPLGSAATYQVANGQLRIAVPYPASAPLEGAYFFASTTDLLNYAAPQTVTRDGDRVVITTKSAGAGGGALDGILRIDADRGLAVSAQPGVVAASTATAAAAPGDAPAWRIAIVALLGAVLGGLILNIMPCVFPILSLKALSLAKANVDEREARREAIAYTLGVVLVCVALGGAILALRGAGATIGWAFQLQDPHAILALLLLTTAISFNLAGLFEVPTPRFVNQSGGVTGAFATGALAAFIATPCTGPFMGAALGAALVLPWPAALAVFAGLGLGLALPFLAIGFIPALRRRLPKPGGWMVTFRHILAVPMFLTALALAWVLGRQAGIDGMTLGLGAALTIAVLLWIVGRRQARGLGAGWVLGVLMLLVAAAAVATIARAPRAVASAAGVTPFSEAKLAELRAQNRPVFAYFTADWCLTCKVNEKAAIETDDVQNAFKAHDVAVLEGDWTDGDAKLGRFIEAHNRAGVPLYLYYAPGASEPQVLPQVLTKSTLEALAAKG